MSLRSIENRICVEGEKHSRRLLQLENAVTGLRELMIECANQASIVDDGAGKISIEPQVDLQNGIFSRGHFDGKWYLERNPDVLQGNVDPFAHYVTYGKHEGRAARYFNARWYTENNPDVEGSKIDGYVHYLKHGQSEGRSARDGVQNSFRSTETSTQRQCEADDAKSGAIAAACAA
jgi:hypothetical protein